MSARFKVYIHQLTAVVWHMKKKDFLRKRNRATTPLLAVDCPTHVLNYIHTHTHTHNMRDKGCFLYSHTFSSACHCSLGNTEKQTTPDIELINFQTYSTRICSECKGSTPLAGAQLVMCAFVLVHVHIHLSE